MEKLKTAENYTSRVYKPKKKHTRTYQQWPNFLSTNFPFSMSTNYSDGGRVSSNAHDLIEKCSCTCEVVWFSSFRDSKPCNRTYKNQPKVSSFHLFCTLKCFWFQCSIHSSFRNASCLFIMRKRQKCGRLVSFSFPFVFISCLAFACYGVISHNKKFCVEKWNAINHCQKFVYKCKISIFMWYFQWYEKWCSIHFSAEIF